MSTRNRLGTLLFMALAVSAGAPGNAAGQSPEAGELTALAQEAIQGQNDVLVSGNAEAAFQGRERAARFRDGIRERIAMNVNRKRVLSQAGNDYKSHRTEVRIDSTSVQGDQATVIAIERVVLTLDPAIKGPPETRYDQAHEMRFVKEGGQWKMVSDVLLQAPPIPGDARGNTGPELADVPGRRPTPRAERRPPAGATSLRPWGDSPFQFASTTGAPRRGSYNPGAAVNYARQYVYNYNPSYRTYSGNDCTNFTSQALRAGGWDFDTVGEEEGTNTWFYGTYSWNTSYSWAAAHNFHWFFKQSGRGYFASGFTEFLTGDLVQADWGPTPDGNISHTMIVTSVDMNNNAYVTYHSNDTYNRSLNDLRATNPGTRWYGLLTYTGW